MIVGFIAFLYPIRGIISDWLHIDRNVGRGVYINHGLGVLLSIIPVVISVFFEDIVTVLNIIASVFGIGLYWIMPLLFIYQNPRLKLRKIVDEPVS